MMVDRVWIVDVDDDSALNHNVQRPLYSQISCEPGRFKTTFWATLSIGDKLIK